MNHLEKIELDLISYRILLYKKHLNDPLLLHFDTPSRKFYFALIAYITNEMKKLDQPDFIFIRKHEQTLKLLDKSLAGKYASKSVDDMWIKIRKAWRDRLPDLEAASYFTIIGRDKFPPIEKGGKYRYDCLDDECDVWATLFQYDKNNPWRYKFAIDAVSLKLSDVHIKHGSLRNISAWEKYVKNILHEKQTATTDENTQEQYKPNMRVRLIFTVSIIIFLIVGGFSFYNYYFRYVVTHTELASDRKLSIVVTPFVNITDDPDKEYFCDGITEELINSLARVRDLRVISRTSAFYFKDKDFDLHTIGKKLNVDHVLEGSVRVSGDNLRISAQLIRVSDDSHLWAETYDREMKDIFITQEKLAQEIACSLRSRLGCNGDETFSKRYTENVEAYQLYLKGRYFENKMSYELAIENFKEAIALDPNYALAYAGLGDVYNIMAFYMPAKVNVKESYLKSKEAILKAIDLDNSLSEAYTALGILKLRYEWDWNGSESALRRAIELNPGNALAHAYYSAYLRAMCLMDEAIEENKIALELDPLSFNTNTIFGLSLANAGYYDQAIEQYYRTLELYPNHPIVLSFIGFVYILTDKIEDGVALLEKAVSITKRNSPFALGGLGCAYGIAGERQKAHAILNEVLERSKQGYFSPFFIGIIYMGLDDKDNAFKWIDKGFDARDPILFPIKCGHLVKSLQSDPRWTELMKKMGLED